MPDEFDGEVTVRSWMVGQPREEFIATRLSWLNRLAHDVLYAGLMGVAANLLAKMLERQRWIAWAGLVIVLYVALSMIWDGSNDIADALRQ